MSDRFKEDRLGATLRPTGRAASARAGAGWEALVGLCPSAGAGPTLDSGGVGGGGRTSVFAPQEGAGPRLGAGGWVVVVERRSSPRRHDRRSAPGADDAHRP